MIIFIPGRKKMNKTLIAAIRNRQLTYEDLDGVYNELKQSRDASKKTFIVVTIIAVILNIFMVYNYYLDVILSSGIGVFFTVIGASTVMTTGILLCIRAYYVNTIKRQFERAVKEGYPERIGYYDFI